MSHTLILDKLFHFPYMKECFIKAAQAMCNCTSNYTYQQKDKSITFYKENPTSQETQVFLHTHKVDEMLPLTIFPFIG